MLVPDASAEDQVPPVVVVVPNSVNKSNEFAFTHVE